ncbi:MAG: DUF4040 domain-containing protein, partial [Thauera sp.]|nr:DUF4040 domain-containing protein [Thauera sp.]
PHTPHDPPLGMWLPPALLVVLVVLIGLFPDPVAGPLVASVSRVVTGGEVMDYHLALWHGFTPALGLSAIAVVCGFFMLKAYPRVRAIWAAGPHPEARLMFRSTISFAVELAQAITQGLHNGALPRYLAFMIATALLLGISAFIGGSHEAGQRPLLEANLATVMVWLMLVGGCLTVLLHHHERIVGLIAVGIVGLVVSVAFVYLSAPDLALTQISVEVVTVVLMLLALNFLPKDTPRESSGARRLRDGSLAVASGLGIGGLAWAVLTRDFETLSGYYLEQSVPGGGGTNVVNVILVDFRGFDTFGEIIVLGIAALTIYALLDGVMRGAVQRKLVAWVPDQARSADRHPMMLVVATRVGLPLALVVGVFIFLRGHNVPGGGFIAGLLVAIALIVQYMASGFSWAAQRMKIDYHGLIGSGVLVAALTGLGAWVAGYPFLTSTVWHLSLPLLGEVHVASAMFFDTGVFLVVVGATMLALANLSRIARRAEYLPVNAEPMDIDPSLQSHSGQG